jgi:hypothetical protein
MKSAIVILLLSSIHAFSHSQDEQTDPSQHHAVSFGLGPTWIEQVPGLFMEGHYQRKLGEHILTGVTFRLSSGYNGFRNEAETLTTSGNIPTINQESRNLTGMNIQLGYGIFPGRHKLVFRGGPGLYYSTLVLSETVNQQLTLTHTSEVVIGFETSVGYKLKLNNGLATGIHLFGMFSRKDSQTGVAVKLEKGF